MHVNVQTFFDEKKTQRGIPIQNELVLQWYNLVQWPLYIHCRLNGWKFFSTHFRKQTVEAAHAEAERIRLIGGSEAGAIECVGKAEAEKMRLKASAYKQYGEAAMLALVLETLPKVRCVSIYIILTYCNQEHH